jgi:SAM-dependent methyltransferase
VTSTALSPPPCHGCGGASAHLVTTKDFNRRTTDASFQYFQCLRCRLVFLDPIPDDMRPFYKGGYQEIPAGVAELRVIAAENRHRLDPLLRYKQSGKLLEIGPWIGSFSCNAKDAGFEVTAIEMDQSCVNFLNDCVGIRALQSSNPSAALAGMQESFDAIALEHCLEHLPEPWLVLQRAAERLAPGGILLITIPNIESNEFAFLRERWRHLDAPRHIYFYPPDPLRELARSCGLEELELTTTDRLSMRLSREAWYFWAVARFRLKYLRGMIGRLAFLASKRKALRDGSGSGITAVFRRPGSND